MISFGFRFFHPPAGFVFSILRFFWVLRLRIFLYLFRYRVR